MTIAAHIKQLTDKHAHLDTQIDKYESSHNYDNPELQALKKKRLKIKEEIHKLQNLTPIITSHSQANSTTFY